MVRVVNGNTTLPVKAGYSVSHSGGRVITAAWQCAGFVAFIGNSPSLMSKKVARKKIWSKLCVIRSRYVSCLHRGADNWDNLRVCC